MMTRSVWGIGSALVIFWSTTCGGIAVLDGPGGEGGRSSTQSSTRSVSTTVGPSTSSVGGPVSTTIATGPGDCAQQPDFLSCAQCLCQVDLQGCQAYLDAIDAHIYCGMTCGMACADYCIDPQNVMPDQACAMCTTGIDCASAPPGSPRQVDCDGFVATCRADMTCVGFAQALQICPE